MAEMTANPAFWIDFEEARRAVETLVDLAHDEPDERPVCVILVGQSGMGKTSILREAQRRIAMDFPEPYDGQEARYAPVLRTVIPSSPTSLKINLTLLWKQGWPIRLWRRRPPLPAMLAFNARLIAGPSGEREQGLRRGELGYQTRFAANRFHLSPTRIALLLSAHGDRSGPAERFERFVALSASAPIAVEDGLLAPKARRDPPRSHVMPRGQTTVWAHRWEADLADLIEAYRWVMTKMAQRGIQNQAREGRSSSTRTDLAPGAP